MRSGHQDGIKMGSGDQDGIGKSYLTHILDFETTFADDASCLALVDQHPDVYSLSVAISARRASSSFLPRGLKKLNKTNQSAKRFLSLVK